MKRLLIGLAILTISTPVVLGVTACSCSHSQTKQPIYNSIEDGLKNIKLNSYVPDNGTIDTVKNNLKLDIIINLLKLEFVNGINFKYLNYNDEALLLEILLIIKSDGTILSAEDLKSIGTLNVQIICKLENKIVYLNNLTTLNIIENNKTDQEVVDYISQLNFDNFLNNSILPFFAGTLVDYFLQQNLQTCIEFVGGSYLASFFDKDKLKQNQILNYNTGKQLSQSDLNQAGNLKLTINFDYGEIKNQNLNLTYNLQKFEFSKIKFPQNLSEIDAIVTSPENLSEDDVMKINVSILKKVIEKFQEWNFTWTVNDFVVQGTENILYVGANFSTAKIIFFNIVAKPDSKMLTGILKNNFITVHVTAS